MNIFCLFKWLLLIKYYITIKIIENMAYRYHFFTNTCLKKKQIYIEIKPGEPTDNFIQTRSSSQNYA